MNTQIHGKLFSALPDAEYYNNGPHETVQAAVEALAAEEQLRPRRLVSVGRLEIYMPAIDEDEVIERLQERCVDESMVEDSNDWLDDATHEQRMELGQKLNDALDEWLDKHGLRPTFGVITDAQEYLVGGPYDGEQ